MDVDGAMSRDALAARLLKVGAQAAGCAVVAQTAAHLANRAWFGTSNLNADFDGSILTWLSVGAALGCAIFALALAALPRANRIQMALLSAVFGLFAFDDLLALHERAGLRATALLEVQGGFARVLWPALYLPLLVFVLVTLWQLSWRTSATARGSIRLGLLCLVAAVGAEMLWATWHLTRGQIGDWPDTVEVAIEEGLELGGLILIASALAGAAFERVDPSRIEAAARRFRARPGHVRPVRSSLEIGGIRPSRRAR
jgi:hypothetical protein